MLKAYWTDENGVEFFDDTDYPKQSRYGDQVYGSLEDYLSTHYEEWERRPEFDDWADHGGVPVGYLIQFHNWWHECFQCDRRVDDEEYDYYEDEGLNPVYRGNQVFCCPDCEKAYDDEKRANKETLQATVLEARGRLESKYPFLEYVGAYSFGPGTVQIDFNAPGFIRTVNWRSSDPDNLWIAQGDQEAFNRLMG